MTMMEIEPRTTSQEMYQLAKEGKCSLVEFLDKKDYNINKSILVQIMPEGPYEAVYHYKTKKGEWTYFAGPYERSREEAIDGLLARFNKEINHIKEGENHSSERKKQANHLEEITKTYTKN